MHTTTRSRDEGFSLIELLMVVALMGIVGAMAMLIQPTYFQHARADAAVSEAIDVFRSAREAAITQRRNVQVNFIAPATLQIVREEVPTSSGTTVLRTVPLSNGMQFLLQNSVPDTPDLFGNATATAFGPSTKRIFTSDGSFIDSNAEILNGSLLLSIPGEKNSARAITVFGPTGHLRVWRWDGVKWTE